MAIEFDMRTLFLAGSVTGIASAGAVFAMRRVHARSSGAALWAAAALLSAGASMLGIAFRGDIPDFLSFTVANTAGTASTPLLYEAVRRLCRAKPQPAFTLLAILAMFAYQLTLGDTPADLASRVVVSSLFGAVYAGLMIPLLARRRSNDPPAAVAAAIVLVSVYLVGHLARAASLLYSGAAMSDDGEFISGFMHTVVAVMFIVVPMLFAMVLMSWINGRAGNELRVRAATDELTGLATRRHAFARARELLAASGRQAPRVRTFGLLMIDLDFFKRINDRFGHGVGDSVLAHVAATLRDALSPEDLVGRYGGEEFCAAVLRPSRASVRSAAEAIRDAVRARPFVHDGEAIDLSVSVGMATDDEFPDFDEILSAADRLLYRAKALGRDRVADSDTPPPRHSRRANDLRADPAATPVGSGGPTAARAAAARPDFLDHVGELVDVLEIPVHGREPHVADLVEPL